MMIKVEAVNVLRIRGNAEKVISQQNITGELEFVPATDGSGSLLLPISVLIETNEKYRKCGISEIRPLSKMDLQMRVVLYLSKAESKKIVLMNIGEKMTLIRRGWGMVWNHVIKKL